MKEANDQRVVAEFPLSATKDINQSAPDLSVLADRLLSIASELRRGQSEGAHARTTQADRNGLVEGIPAASHDPVLPAAERSASGMNATIKRPLMEDDHRRLVFAQEARATYARRRERTAIFIQSELFGEPAWDILLDLYIAHAENKQVSVSSAFIGSAAPPTTGLRWLGVLTDNGLIVREHDPEDQRRVLVRLSEQGVEAMDTYFEKTLTSA